MIGASKADFYEGEVHLVRGARFNKSRATEALAFNLFLTGSAAYALEVDDYAAAKLFVCAYTADPIGKMQFPATILSRNGQTVYNLTFDQDVVL